MGGKLGLPNLGAYSITAPNSPHGDESMWARAVAEAYNIPWHSVDSETILPFSHLPDEFAWQAEPTSAVIHIKSHHLLDQLFAEHGVRSILTGHGGDRLLGASSGAVSPHLVDILFAGHPLTMLHALRDWSARHFETRSWSFLMARAVLGPAWAHLRGYRFEAGRPLPVPAWIDRDYDRRWNLMKLSRQCIATRDHSPGRQEIWDSVWAHAVSGGMAREHEGYDVRRPFLYRPFLEFMYAVPPDLRVRPRCDRYLQRRALKGVLPELVRRRGNKVFGTWAFVEGLARSRGWVEYLSDDPEMERMGITSTELWREAVQQALVGNTAGDRFFFTGVALEAWLKGRAQWRPRERRMTFQ
jgi:asparagine synthetase B (glutamine-hydrolysing)